MRRLVCMLGCLLIVPAGVTRAQQPAGSDACKFKVSESTAKPTITGPEEIVKLVHVVEQPDSPVEILAVNFKSEGFVSVYNEQFTEQLRCTVKVRNRSDRFLRGARVSIDVAGVSGGVGMGGRSKALAPGEEAEFDACGGHGGGGAKSNHLRILVSVAKVDLGSYVYEVSRRLPKDLGIYLSSED